MNKQLKTTLFVFILTAPIFLTGCWRKKSMAIGLGDHEISISKTDRANTSRYGVDFK